MNGIRVNILIKAGEKILLIHRVKNDSEYYVLPGGGVEEGENVKDAAIREAKEETGLDVEIDNELWKFHNRADNREHIYFFAPHFSGTLQLGGPEADRQSAQNQYMLEWVNKDKFTHVKFFPEEIKPRILEIF